MSLKAHRSLRLLAMLAIAAAHLLPRDPGPIARGAPPSAAATVASF